MELIVYNIKGEDTGKKVELDSAVFGIEPNDHAIYLDVKQYLANQRHGTHKSKERAEITGSTRKIKRQKGTGTARAGSIKSPLFRGGGRAFGPEPRDYNFKLNKKVKRLARQSALAHKLNSNSIKVIEDFTFETPKTKEFVAVAKSLELTDQKALIVVSDLDKNLVLAARNIKKAEIITAKDLNTYSILNSTSMVITEGSVKVIGDLFKA